MAKGMKTGGRNFKPGQVTNPHGRPKVPEELKGVRKLNRQLVEQMLNEFLAMDANKLKEIKQNPSSTMFELMVHSIVVNAVNKGDHQRLTFLLDRLVGKVKDEVEVQVNPFMNKSVKELEALVKAKMEKK